MPTAAAIMSRLRRVKFIFFPSGWSGSPPALLAAALPARASILHGEHAVQRRLDLGRVAEDAHAHESCGRIPEQVARREADMRLLQDVGAELSRVALAFHGEEGIHAAARLCGQHDVVDARKLLVGEVEAGL